MKIKKKVGIGGIYSFKATNAKTGKQRPLFDIEDSENLVVNSGLNAFGVGSTMLYRCVVGTDSSPVLPGQTSLGNQIASTTSVPPDNTQVVTGARPSPPYFWWGRKEWRFGQGVAAGNLTEVGVTNASGVLISRALIVDSGGTPTTLTILADEYLDVTYELRVYPDTEDQEDTITLMGEVYDLVFRFASVTSSPSSTYFDDGITSTPSGSFSLRSGGIATITGAPSGSSYSDYWSFKPYIADSFERTFIGSAGLDDANFSGGIGSVYGRTAHGWFQIGITPKIPKDNFKTLVLEITLQWSAYTPP